MKCDMIMKMERDHESEGIVLADDVIICLIRISETCQNRFKSCYCFGDGEIVLLNTAQTTAGCTVTASTCSTRLTLS